MLPPFKCRLHMPVCMPYSNYIGMCHRDESLQGRGMDDRLFRLLFGTLHIASYYSPFMRVLLFAPIKNWSRALTASPPLHPQNRRASSPTGDTSRGDALAVNLGARSAHPILSSAAFTEMRRLSLRCCHDYFSSCSMPLAPTLPLGLH